MHKVENGIQSELDELDLVDSKKKSKAKVKTETIKKRVTEVSELTEDSDGISASNWHD